APSDPHRSFPPSSGRRDLPLAARRPAARCGETGPAEAARPGTWNRCQLVASVARHDRGTPESELSAAAASADPAGRHRHLRGKPPVGPTHSRPDAPPPRRGDQTMNDQRPPGVFDKAPGVRTYVLV